MKATIIVTEKRSISNAIVRALNPESFDENGNSSSHHCDILTLKPLRHRRSLRDISCEVLTHNPHQKSIYYFCQLDCTKCGFEAQYLDSMGNRGAGRIKRKIRYLNEGKDFKDKLVSEEIDYYLFRKKEDLVIVLSTNGNPYRFDRQDRKKGSKHLEWLILESENWEKLKGKLTHVPNKAIYSRNDLRSYKGRSFLFNHVLARNRLPVDFENLKAGSKIKIERIIAATDFDIAGSFIILSVIEYGNVFVKEYSAGRDKGLAAIDLSKLYRMILKDMNSSTIVEQFNNPLPFDWENAYAGKVRSIFDFLYGVTITNQFRHFKQRVLKIKDPSNTSFSVGRTLFLGLKKTIEEERKIENEKERNYVYIVFDGFQDKQEVEDALLRKDFSVVQVKQRIAGVSRSKFMELCREDKVGTHTTRCRLIERLEKKHLIKSIGKRIMSTPFGNFYYSYLARFLDSSEEFKISHWSHTLQGAIDCWKTSQEKLIDYEFKPKEEIEEKFLIFMNSFLSQLKRHLRKLRTQYAQIVTELWDAYLKMPIVSSMKPEQREIAKSDGFRLVGNSSLLHSDKIQELIDTNPSSPYYNTPLAKKTPHILRITPQQFVPVTEPVRRVCNVDSKSDLKIVDSYESHKIVSADKAEYTVFRTRIKDKQSLRAVLDSDLRIERFSECDLDESNFEEENILSPHDSLQLIDVFPSDIAGKEGMLLVEEYHRPWVATQDKIDKRRKGLINLQTFTLEEYFFERVERYRFGFVHNFESLLITMFEKYNMPFSKTAKLAEELYLNIGD